MSDFQCKFYLLDGAETLECKDGNAEYVAKIADRPFLICSLYERQ